MINSNKPFMQSYNAPEVNVINIEIVSGIANASADAPLIDGWSDEDNPAINL